MDNYHKGHILYLWEAFLNGDDKSFSSLYELHIDQLISYGYKLCIDHELVHDSLQEIFIDLFLKREKLNADIKHLKAYLFVSLRNSLIKKIKSSKRIELFDIKDNKFEFDFNVEYSYQDRLIDEEISQEIRELLEAATQKLPAKQKEIIYLKFEEEMSYPEIAEIMNISVESARKLLYRALLTLRSEIPSDSFTSLFFILFSKISQN
ncbi:sigma-70 family RNA polymerase sigma factor [Maribellus sp. YY47]|uniref:RNA polymerase sigma factor n=1 Tax=Maribellus sp. YY47 TaxID=2929486 RepID=UPI002001919A|nr:sigma-70 family RNA polymerase sigma factor [Maribellus sp. YY47]MCK3684067.1 sigma-70 family RNA polymerase sigma factor [Maribellus sp. YY47]